MRNISENAVHYIRVRGVWNLLKRLPPLKYNSAVFSTGSRDTRRVWYVPRYPRLSRPHPRLSLLEARYHQRTIGASRLAYNYSVKC